MCVGLIRNETFHDCSSCYYIIHYIFNTIKRALTPLLSVDTHTIPRTTPPQPIFILDDDDMDVEPQIEAPIEPDLMEQFAAVQAAFDCATKRAAQMIGQVPTCPICLQENKTPTVYSSCATIRLFARLFALFITSSTIPFKSPGS